MLSSLQHSSLGTYTCPNCGRPLGVFHAYPVLQATLLTCLTESVPMHRECAVQYHQLQEREPLSIVWIVRSSSPNAPSGRLFNKAPKGEPKDLWIHLQNPNEIIIQFAGRPATYEEIQEALEVTMLEVGQQAASQEEIDAIPRQLAWLMKYLPKRLGAE